MRTISAGVCALVVSCAFYSTNSQAQTADLTLQDLFQGGTITADDKRFFNWQLQSFETQGDAFGSPASIFVTPLEDDPLNPGVKFNIPNGMGTDFSNGGNSFVILRFSFDVQTTSGQALIKDNSLWLNGFNIDASTGVINISETISDASGASLGSKSVFAVPGDLEMSGDPDHFDSAEFAPQSFVHVEKFIEILGPGVNDGVVLTMFEQRFSQIPEPGTLLLAAVLMICTCGESRSRRSG